MKLQKLYLYESCYFVSIEGWLAFVVCVCNLCKSAQRIPLVKPVNIPEPDNRQLWKVNNFKHIELNAQHYKVNLW